VDKFFSLFLKSYSNPISKITEYFIRIEFQARGSSHAHALIWVEDASQINVQSDDAVCEFTDKYFTCSANPIQPDLQQEVALQRHHHLSACRRGKQKSCRFRYPQLPSRRTIITRPPKMIEHMYYLLEVRAAVLAVVRKEIEKPDADNKTLVDILQACGITENQYQELLAVLKTPNVYMKRKPSDIWTNNYNPDILRTWRGNIDIQYITDVYACIMYIVSYACKAENSMSEMLKRVIKKNSTDVIRMQMKKVAATFLNHQEISAHEAAYKLLSLYLKKMSRKVIFVDSNDKNNRVRLSKPYEEIKNKKDDDQDLFFTSVHDKYASRPEHLEHMCLAEFATNYRSMSEQRVDDHLHEDEAKDDDVSTEPGSVI